MEKSNIPEELAEFIRGEARRLNYELVDMTTRSGRGFFLEVVIDRKGGITLDECGGFNRRIMSWIDEKELFGKGYTVDVCSPGLDRELKSDGDFLWAVGKQVEVRTHNPIENKSTIVGKLLKGSNADRVAVEKADGGVIRIDKDNMAKVKLKDLLIGR